MIDELRKEYAKEIEFDGYVEITDLYHCHMKMSPKSIANLRYKIEDLLKGD